MCHTSPASHHTQHLPAQPIPMLPAPYQTGWRAVITDHQASPLDVNFVSANPALSRESSSQPRAGLPHSHSTQSTEPSAKFGTPSPHRLSHTQPNLHQQPVMPGCCAHCHHCLSPACCPPCCCAAATAPAVVAAAAPNAAGGTCCCCSGRGSQTPPLALLLQQQLLLQQSWFSGWKRRACSVEHPPQ